MKALYHEFIKGGSKTQEQQQYQPQSYLIGAAIIGDIIGSRFENMPNTTTCSYYKPMDFTLITPDCLIQF